MASRPKLTLRSWIDEIGVYHWRRRSQLPRAKQMSKIAYFTKGALTPSAIIEEFLGEYKPTKTDLVRARLILKK